MNDPRDREPYTPPQASLDGTPAPAPGKEPGGSLGAGIALFFLSLIGGVALAAFVRMVGLLAVPRLGAFFFGLLTFLVLPFLIALVIGIWMSATGRPRTALGMLVGFGIFVAGVLLLVAACFGIVSSLNIH